MSRPLAKVFDIATHSSAQLPASTHDPVKPICFSTGIQMQKNRFPCPYCNKQYQFSISLQSHKKFKHKKELPKQRRGRPKLVKRGRPKKIVISPIVAKDIPKSVPALLSDFDDAVYEIYHLHIKHPLYDRIAEVLENTSIENKKCDHILAKYVHFLHATKSKEQARVGIIFIILNRPFLCTESLLEPEFCTAPAKAILKVSDVEEQTVGFCKWLFENSCTDILLSMVRVKD